MTTDWMATGGWWRYKAMDDDYDYVDVCMPMMRLVNGHRQDGSLLIIGKVLACSVATTYGRC